MPMTQTVEPAGLLSSQAPPIAGNSRGRPRRPFIMKAPNHSTPRMKTTGITPAQSLADQSIESLMAGISPNLDPVVVARLAASALADAVPASAAFESRSARVESGCAGDAD
jgi:hypothetical protein